MAVPPEILLERLKALAAQLGIEVRFRAMDTPGGLCRVRQTRLILVNETLSTAEKVAVVAASLPLEELEGLYVSPAVREAIERAHTTR